MNMQQQMISFQTGLMRALETATVAAAAARGAADAAQGSGRPSGPSGPPELASVPNVQIWPEHKQDPSNQRVARRGAQVL